MQNQFSLELNGQPAGPVLSVEGGDLSVHSPTRGDPTSRRGIPVRSSYSDMRLECGMGMSRQFYDWVKTLFALNHQFRNGAVVASSATGSTRKEFVSALLARVALPELHKATRKPATMTATLSPENVEYRQSASGGPKPAPSKGWLASNFRFEIDGMEEECKQVVGVSAVSATAKVTQIDVGKSRTTQRLPVGVGLSPLVLTLPMAGAAAFRQWVNDSTLRGTTASVRKPSGSLEYLSPGGQPYLRLDLHGLSPYGFGTKGAEAEATLRCDSMSLSFLGA